MNKTGIEWCDYTWNPVVGCTKGCPWCYARRLAKRLRCPECRAFVPHLHSERLVQPDQVKKPSVIFCGSMGEVFDPVISYGVREAIGDTIGRAHQHEYIILTKRPERIDMPLRGNLTLGVSVTNQADADERKPPLLKNWPGRKVMSYEPALGALSQTRLPMGALDWLIIGAQTGPKAVKPEREWIASAVEHTCLAHVRVFVKDNIVKHYPEFAGIREWPAGMRQEAGA